MDENALGEVVLEQIKQQGMSCIRISDGHVLTIPTWMLEQLLAKSRASETGHVMIRIQSGAEA